MVNIQNQDTSIISTVGSDPEDVLIIEVPLYMCAYICTYVCTCVYFAISSTSKLIYICSLDLYIRPTQRPSPW